MRNKFVLIITFFLFCGCATKGADSSSTKMPKVSLKTVESFPLGVATLKDIRKAFGEPSREVKLGASEDELGWAFYAGNGQEFSFTFDAKSGVLQGSVWAPLPEQPEFNIKRALASFPKGHFEKITRQWTAADAIYEQTIYLDKSSGVEISLWNYSDSKVETISWGRPSKGSLQRLPSQKSN